MDNNILAALNEIAEFRAPEWRAADDSDVDFLQDIARAALARAGIAAPTALGSAFITLESGGGEGRTIVMKFNRRDDAYSVHDFLLKGGGRDYSAAPAAAVQPSEQSDVLADVRKWIVKNRPAITLSRQVTVDEYLYLLKRIDTALAATPEQKG